MNSTLMDSLRFLASKAKTDMLHEKNRYVIIVLTNLKDFSFEKVTIK